MSNPFGADVDPDAVPDPMTLVRAWVGAPDRPLVMTLTTVGDDGAPDARHVHLFEVADEEIRFHTDARSRKAAQLRADARVTLAFFWPEPLRQLVVAGVAASVPTATLDADFARISRYLQVLSWVNDDALAARPAGERREVLAAFEAAHPGPLARPEWWIGHSVRPHRVTFWRGDDAGPSNRLEYTRRPDGTWETTRLAG
ncbi:pyridoxamine 5'-phosphate oxidase family protein [Georgenia thermotolerans]|uniref:Pyridoxine 5'-phosphate oxidase n=1 Tax=Georgenia thermotolerans TaxID=527326 RepID=A0A7J5UTH9_9MICO|nr:pyridoxamine 5'-phosphate oxidase family protein [Georgenia thermotolerans]KAE8765582.1 pyridoxine 5'-phosphate oxidase [Georgenia thermotolerans]